MSIRETIVALSASTVLLNDGHLTSPRYVLILDKHDRLVGIVNRRDLLRGLVPHFAAAEKARERLRGLVSLGEEPLDASIDWASLFSRTAIKAAARPIRSAMIPIQGKVNVEDSLSRVITTMIQHKVDVVPVMDGDKLAGVVLMTDVFDIAAQFIMESGGG